MIPEQHLYIIASLRRLQRLTLSISFGETWSKATLEPLQYLTALTLLTLNVSSVDKPLLLSPTLTRLTCLRDLVLRDWAPTNDDNGRDHHMQVVSKLTGLTSLVLDGMLRSVPAGIGSLSHLVSLEVCDVRVHRFIVSPCIRSCTQLQYVSLSILPVASTKAWQDVCRSLSLLPKLQSLQIKFADLSRVRPRAWFLPSHLTSLRLQNCHIQTLPEAICKLSLLQKLCLTGCQLSSLPSGRYLCNLRLLAITVPQSGSGPEALADATCLQELQMDFEKCPENPLWAETALQSLVPKGCKFYDFIWHASGSGPGTPRLVIFLLLLAADGLNYNSPHYYFGNTAQMLPHDHSPCQALHSLTGICPCLPNICRR